eukprot:2662952-Amphidinium_carterae.2
MDIIDEEKSCSATTALPAIDAQYHQKGKRKARKRYINRTTRSRCITRNYSHQLPRQSDNRTLLYELQKVLEDARGHHQGQHRRRRRHERFRRNSTTKTSYNIKKDY